MVITSIESVASNRFKVFIDEQFAFVLYKGELSRYKIKENQEITEAIYEEINKEVILKRGKKRALHILNTMPRTEQQLREKLESNFYPKDIIEQVMEYIKGFGYINDEIFAYQFITAKKEKKSRKEIELLLRKKGVDKAVICDVYDAHFSDDETQVIEKLVAKKIVDLEQATEAEKSKVVGMLLRKGFKYENIRQVIQVY